MKKVIFRADGSNRIGWGHMYRLLALAEMLRNNFECVFVSNNPDRFILSEIKRICSDCIILNGAISEKRPDERTVGEEMLFDMEDILSGNEIVVTDGYLIGPNYQLAIKRKGNILVCLDDLITRKFHADVVINAAPGVRAEEYDLSDVKRLCLGLDYMILRPSFFEMSHVKYPENGKVVYISFGGSDYLNFSEKCLLICDSIEQIRKIYLIFSDSFNESVKLRLIALQKLKPEKIILLKNVKSEEIINVLSVCTHALVSASTVCLEVISRKIKPLIGYYVDNQKRLYEGVLMEELALGMGYIQNGLPIEAIKMYVNQDAALERKFTNHKLWEIFN